MVLLGSANAYAADAPSPSVQLATKPGVTVTADDASPTGYTATFVYQEADPNVSNIVLYSDTFLLWDEQAPQYTGGANGMNLNNVSAAHKAAYGHPPNEYQPTYWPGGGSGSSRFASALTKAPGTDLWSLQVPLMSGAFIYNYEITRNGVTTGRLDDPANPALVNTATGVRSLSSLVYVPYNAAKQGTDAYRDRSIELPRTDGRKGTVQTITYPAANGTNRGMSVYLPYGYTANTTKPYNVLYINMGNSGDQFGNELRWMNEGDLPNIVDNLVAQGHEPFVAVSMNYQDWGHNFSRIEPDVLNNVLPFVESHYNVSTDRSGRGYAGLSAGAGTTARFYLNHPDVFSQFGIWSNGVTPTPEQLTKVAMYEDSTTVHIGMGKWDYVTAARPMDAALTANGIDHTYLEIPGGHDWELWQLMFSDFAKNHLWHDTGQVYPTSTTLPGRVHVSNSAGTAANNKPVDVTTAQANAAVDAGVAIAQADGLAIATAHLTQPGNISLATLQGMAARAGMPLQVKADSISANGKETNVSLTFKPGQSTQDLNLWAATESGPANSLTSQFGRLFSNDVMAIVFAQEGSFGQPVEVTVKLDKNLKTDNLVVYSYDPATNAYSRVNTTVSLDSTGYAHFTTQVAGDLILSDGELLSR
jgi:enterochelin esterase-like enzyme